MLAQLDQTPSLSLLQVQNGLLACYIVHNRAFVQRRIGQRTLEEIDGSTRSIIAQVFDKLGFADRQLTLGGLHHLWKTLDEHYGFESEPDLAQRHNEIISNLLDRAEPG